MNLLISEEEEDNAFVILARAVQLPAPATSSAWQPTPAASSAGGESGTPITPPPSPVLLDMCKPTAARLDVPWPAAVAEAHRSCYKGKKLLLARIATKQPLPVFPKLLEELMHSWVECPYSGQSPIRSLSTGLRGNGEVGLRLHPWSRSSAATFSSGLW